MVPEKIYLKKYMSDPLIDSRKVQRLPGRADVEESSGIPSFLSCDFR